VRKKTAPCCNTKEMISASQRGKGKDRDEDTIEGTGEVPSMEGGGEVPYTRSVIQDGEKGRMLFRFRDRGCVVCKAHGGGRKSRKRGGGMPRPNEKGGGGWRTLKGGDIGRGSLEAAFSRLKDVFELKTLVGLFTLDVRGSKVLRGGCQRGTWF